MRRDQSSGQEKGHDRADRRDEDQKPMPIHTQPLRDGNWRAGQ
jgi:hypothetical protein